MTIRGIHISPATYYPGHNLYFTNATSSVPLLKDLELLVSPVGVM